MKSIVPILTFLIAISCLAQTNPNHVKVKEHRRSDGTVVKEHYRTAPNHTNTDNFSTKPNTNPYTGEKGWIEPDGYANPYANSSGTYIPTCKKSVCRNKCDRDKSMDGNIHWSSIGPIYKMYCKRHENSCFKEDCINDRAIDKTNSAYCNSHTPKCKRDNCPFPCWVKYPVWMGSGDFDDYCQNHMNPHTWESYYEKPKDLCHNPNCTNRCEVDDNPIFYSAYSPNEKRYKTYCNEHEGTCREYNCWNIKVSENSPYCRIHTPICEKHGCSRDCHWLVPTNNLSNIMHSFGRYCKYHIKPNSIWGKYWKD